MKSAMRRRALRNGGDDSGAEDDARPLIVPLNNRALVPTSADRVRRLRKHLLETLRAWRDTSPPAPSVSVFPPELDEFAARVAQAACTLCKGWCCKGGGEHAYLDERTMARVRRNGTGLTARSMMQLYLERVPDTGYEGSCIFHGREGCTLTRALRSNICNDYFCTGLGTYVTAHEPPTPVVVIAGDGNKMRTSPILSP